MCADRPAPGTYPRARRTEDEKITIMTDPASDISAANEKKHGIVILPCPITPAGRTCTSRVDFDSERSDDMVTEPPGYGPSAVYQTGAAVAADSGPSVVGVSFNRKAEQQKTDRPARFSRQQEGTCI